MHSVLLALLFYASTTDRQVIRASFYTYFIKGGLVIFTRKFAKNTAPPLFDAYYALAARPTLEPYAVLYIFLLLLLIYSARGVLNTV
jgi:hypothetical protein